MRDHDMHDCVAYDNRPKDAPLPTPVRECINGRWRYYLVHDEQSGAIESVTQARYEEVQAQRSVHGC